MRMSEEEFKNLIARRQLNNVVMNPETHHVEKKSDKKKRGPNKTETEYGNMLNFEFVGCAVKFEAMSLVLENGHRYTPDWTVALPMGQILCVEVKNAAYQHASYGRSKMAFAQCRLDWPMFQYRWAEKTKEGWDVKGD